MNERVARSSAAQAPAGLAIHGGHLLPIARELGCEVRDLLDFSANLNPLGPPASLLRELRRAAADLDELQRYPEPDSARLRGALGRKLGISPETIVVANGAAALLDVAIAAFDVKRCLVPIPAFSEDARALGARGALAIPLQLDRAREFTLDADAVTTAIRERACDAVLLTNPHNPTGSVLGADAMRRLIASISAVGCRVLLDEAFVDFASGASVTVEAARRDDTIVIRSLTKIYATPALRAGYAVATDRLAKRMRALLPSWPVGTLETLAFEAALDDRDYLARTHVEVGRNRTLLARELEARGFTVTPGAANFLLVRLREGDPHSSAVTRALATGSRVIVRDCASYEGLDAGRYLRVAVRSQVDNARLIRALDLLSSDRAEKPGPSGFAGSDRASRP